MKRWKLLAVLTVGAMAAGLVGVGVSQERRDPREAWRPAFDPSGAKYVMRVSNVSTPALDGVMAGFRIRDALWERTNGQLYFDYYPLSMLGGEVEVINQLAMGAIQGMLCSSVVAPRIGPRYGVVNLPFLIDTPEKLDKFIADKEVFDHFLKSGEANGITALDITAYGTYGWASTRPIRTLADARPLKFRIAEADVNQSLYRAWGLNIVPMPWPEVQVALQNRVIDAIDHTGTVSSLTKKFEVATHFVEVNYAQGLFIHLVNKRWFDSLPADLQTALVEVVREESAKSRANSVVQEQTELQKARDQGIVFVRLPDEDTATLKRQGEAVFKEWEGRIGADYLKKVKDLVGYRL
ncbi:MAG: TRAP transporter substrate-binding protein [Deferrisomatales bacterium]|nr:TRAP transporter substrate-binding protein [Deferrisomatales bacterium]